MLLYTDSLTLDSPRTTKDGFLAVRAKAARVGVYRYTGREVDPENRHGLRDKGLVNVLRDDATVFDAAAVRSFIGKPVTDNHPSEPVTAANWRQHARGTIMGALRDGDYLAFDLLLTDAEAIAKVNAGKRELSNGYAAELEYGRFVAADGTVCDARQSRITGGNHVAIVDAGRAGPECAICDAAPFELLSQMRASTMHYDNQPYVSPAQARQAQIAQEAAQQYAARRAYNDRYVADCIASTAADLANGRAPSSFANARYTGSTASFDDSASMSLADHSDVVSALRTARYL